MKPSSSNEGLWIRLRPDIASPILRQLRRIDRSIVADYPMDIWHATKAAYAWLALEPRNVVVSVHGNDFLRPYIDVERPQLYRLAGLWRFAENLNGIDRLIGRWRTRRLVDEALRKVAHVVTNSRYTEAAFLQKHPERRNTTSVGLVGVGADFLNVSRIDRAPGEPARLLTVAGRLTERRKNVDLVLRALAGLKERFDFTYTIVGDGALRPKLEYLAYRLDLQARVRFTGRLPKAAQRDQMASSDLFILASSVLPHSHEGFGIAYLEANACGTPVLAARLAGAVEAVAEGVSGMFVDEPSVPALKTALAEFLSGRARFSAEACREHARQFGWSRVTDHVLSCYEDVLRSRNPCSRGALGTSRAGSTGARPRQSDNA
jgi:phosphatidylinositol alpha-1,6-mannosyltransferase